MSKVDAARLTLLDINPDVDISAYNYDITSVENYAHFSSTIQLGGKDTCSSVDLVLSCVDNYNARLAINDVRMISSFSLSSFLLFYFFFL